MRGIAVMFSSSLFFLFLSILLSGRIACALHAECIPVFSWLQPGIFSLVFHQGNIPWHGIPHTNFGTDVIVHIHTKETCTCVTSMPWKSGGCRYLSRSVGAQGSIPPGEGGGQTKPGCRMLYISCTCFRRFTGSLPAELVGTLLWVAVNNVGSYHYHWNL